MAFDIEDLFNRIVAVQVELLNDIGMPGDALPVFFHVQEVCPYWTNRLTSVQVVTGSAETYGEEIDVYAYTITMRLMIGNTTQGVDQEAEIRLNQLIQHTFSYFGERELLQSERFPAAPESLQMARVTGSTGLTEYRINDSWQQLGTEFTLRLEVTDDLDQSYL